MCDKVCAECQEPADLNCSGCRMVSYCGKEHQKKHWKQHKSLCRPFIIEQDEAIGKCLIATRDLNPGDLILTEHPIVSGPTPHMVEEGPVPCPGCYRLIVGEESPRCPNCDFPVCDTRCPGLQDMEHHGHECMILALRDISAINGLHDFYRQDTLLSLRCLLLQKRHPKKYAQLMDMEAHLERRGKGTDVYNEVQDRIFNYLDDNFFRPLKCMEMKTGKSILPDTSKETIHKICGIIDVNALEINQYSEMSVLYPTAYLMEHSCVPNTVHTFDLVSQGYKINIRAALPIKKGDHISTMYTHALWGTQGRREHLRETKYFSCSCKRCSDPSELGTNFSSLLCMGSNEEPCGGLQSPINPLDYNTEWACNKCQIRLTNGEVSYLVNRIGEEVDNVQLSSPTVRELDALLTKMATFLHPNHYHCYAVKHSLIQLYGYQQGYMPSQITDETLNRKANMCRELLEVTKKLDPGNSRLPLYSGVILHELHLANMILVKRKWDLGMKTRVKGMLAMLQECNQSLAEAKEVLKNEFTTPAGEKLNKVIATSTHEFNRWLERNKIDLNKN
ncbi:hypothetical protein WA026_010947 [Henosepilachna vigintioctopunctata]|uniref:Protein msta n=1 Tax=Henosepilachna vigintioctopunctata TaxID=420089 RepID=A0AAW1V002_9CUCU